MSKKTAFIRARTEPEVKERAEAVLRGIGLSPSRAVDLFYRQVALRGELPLELKLPNELTEAAIDDARERRGLVEAESAEELFDLLDEE